MTEQFSDRSSDRHDNDPPSSYSYLAKIFQFLNRDIKTFIPRVRRKNIPDGIHLNASIESLVNPDHLSALLFQREVLNWRDNAHAHVTKTAIKLQQQFNMVIEEQLSEIGLLKSIFSDPAENVLGDQFDEIVSKSLLAELKNIESDMKRLREHDSRDIEQTFDIGKLQQKLSFPNQIDFTPKNHELITDNIDNVLFGSGGIVENLRDQATLIARQLLEEDENAEHNPI